MRTTLDIDNDVLAVIKELASSRRTTAGKVISELARKGLQANRADQNDVIRNGFELLPTASEAVTVELVEKLLEEEE
jgi:hypothetical protein